MWENYKAEVISVFRIEGKKSTRLDKAGDRLEFPFNTLDDLKFMLGQLYAVPMESMAPKRIEHEKNVLVSYDGNEDGSWNEKGKFHFTINLWISDKESGKYLEESELKKILEIN